MTSRANDSRLSLSIVVSLLGVEGGGGLNGLSFFLFFFLSLIGQAFVLYCNCKRKESIVLSPSIRS